METERFEHVDEMDAAKKNKQEAAAIWRQYQRGKEYLHKYDYYFNIEEAYRYYKGDQWNGLKLSGEKPPALNILAPIVDYKVATVANNGMSIHYSTMNYGQEYERSMEICELLNRHGAKTWERLKMDRELWRHVMAAAISGDSCAYFYQSEKGLIEAQMLDMTAVHFADEQERDIQKQKYILLAQRLFVSEVREQARQNGLEESEIELILPDSDVQTQIGQMAKQEIKQDEGDGKCICLLKMWKENGEVHFLRSTKNVVYQEATRVAGMKLYPIAHLCWDEEKGSARGIGEVVRRIPNQMEINKTLARNIAAIKQTAYPHIVYDRDKLSAEAVGRLGVVGSTIAVGKGAGGIVEDIRKHLHYLEPAQINPTAIHLVSELMTATRDLAGAGEAVTGNINPEKASGAAIIAVRDANALPLNHQAAALKQFVEDIALIWFDMWVAYHPGGLEIITEQEASEVGLDGANPYGAGSLGAGTLGSSGAGTIDLSGDGLLGTGGAGTIGPSGAGSLGAGTMDSRGESLPGAKAGSFAGQERSLAQLLTEGGTALAAEQWESKKIPVVQTVSAEALQSLKIDVRIDVSPNNPYSKFAQEQALQNLLQMQLITFEDYVEALDDDSAAPKAKLKEILAKQKLRQSAQMQAQMAGNEAQMAQMAQMQAAEEEQHMARRGRDESVRQAMAMMEQFVADSARGAGEDGVKGEE